MRLDEQLYRDVKTRAAQRGTTVTSVIEEALRRLLEEAPGAESDRPLPTYDLGELLPGVPSLDDMSAVEDYLEESVPLDALR